MLAKKAEKLPVELTTALRASAKVLKAWESLKPSCRQEYLKWVVEAKKPETRKRRAASVVEKIMSPVN